MPDTGDEVLVAFEHGDPRRPYVLGGLWNGKDKPPEKNDGGNERRTIVSRAGSRIIFDDDKKTITLTDGKGVGKIVIEEKTIRELLGKKPIFGICLGHQIMGLALGGKTYKLKFGHHGGNQPVMDLTTRKVEITSQNHGFAVDADSLKGAAEVTHINLNDNTVEGLAHRELPIFSVQYHPESSPGPHDADYLFERFIKLMRDQRSR